MKRLTNTTSCLEEYEKHGTAQAELRHECVRRLAKKIQGQFLSFIDPMAGVGVDAAHFAGVDMTYPQVPTVGGRFGYVNDIDPKCREILKTKFQNVSGYSFFKSDERAILLGLCKPDLVYLDLNNFTLAKWAKGEYRAELDDSFAAAQKFLILNDCSYFFLRMWGKGKTGFRRYSEVMGMHIKSADDYFAALPGFFQKHYPRWTLTAIAPFFHASPKGNGGTAYLLFER